MKPEASVMKAITDLLDAYRIPWWRMNSGDHFGTTNGRKWRIKGHAAGTADLLCAPMQQGRGNPDFLWIEVKAPRERPTGVQLEFRDFVTEKGMYWIQADSADEVTTYLRDARAIR